VSAGSPSSQEADPTVLEGRPAIAGTGLAADRGSGTGAPSPVRWRVSERVLQAAAGALAVCVVGTALATVVLAVQGGTRADQPGTPSMAASTATGRSRQARSGRFADGRSLDRNGSRTGSGRALAPDRSTQLAVQPLSANLDAATVSVPASSYRVTVSVTGVCWVEGVETASGTDVWSGVLQAGQEHRFVFQGPVLLRMGAADASVRVDGKPLTLPAGHHAPYDVTFEPSST